MNLIQVTGADGLARLGDGAPIANSPVVGSYTLGIRPEQIRIEGGGASATVVYQEDLGSHANVVARLSDGQSIQISIPAEQPVPGGGTIRIRFPTEHLRGFDRTSGSALDPVAQS